MLHFDGLYGQDAYEYLRYTNSLKTFFESGKNPGDYFWGIYYPLLGSLVAFVVGNSALALQIISFLSLLVSSIYLNKIIELIYKVKTNPVYVFLCFTISPIVFIHSCLAMSDMLTCALIIVSIYWFFSYLEFSSYKSFLFGVAFCLLAILTRYVVVVILFPFGIAVLVKALKNKHFKLVLFSIPIILVISLPHVIVKSQNSLEFLSHHWLQNWDIFNLFKSNFVTIEGPRNNNFINLIYILFVFLHPIFMIFGIGIIGYSFKNRFEKLNKYQILLVISTLTFLLFIGGVPYQNKRYLIPSFALIIILIYPILKDITLLFKNRNFYYCLVFVLQISLVFYFGKQFYDRNILEKNMTNRMKSFQGKTLYVFDIDVALQGRGLEFNYKNLFLQKYQTFEENALVLINEKQLNEQWKGKNPLINWENIQKNCKLIKLNSSQKDWSLYRISNTLIKQ